MTKKYILLLALYSFIFTSQYCSAQVNKFYTTIGFPEVLEFSDFPIESLNDTTWFYTNHEGLRIRCECGASDFKNVYTCDLYYDNNQKYTSFSYLNGAAEGPQEIWDYSGNRVGILRWEDGALSGIARTWHANGSRKIKTHFSRGYITGPLYIWYENDTLMFDAPMFNSGLPHGLIVLYDEDGNKTEEGSYSMGKRDGLTIRYFPNGNMELTANYQASIIHGNSTIWYENGQVKNRLRYDQGKMTDSLIAYYPNGNLMARAKMSNDLVIGDSYDYYESGKIRSLTHYLPEGNMTSQKAWNESGKLVSHQYLKDGQQIELKYFYYTSGALRTLEHSVDLSLDTLSIYYESGTLKSTEVYKFGKLNGTQQDWDENGMPTEASEYELGILSKWTLYDEKGNKMKAILYAPEGWTKQVIFFNKKGKKHGGSIHYDQEKNVIKREFWRNGVLVSEE